MKLKFSNNFRGYFLFYYSVLGKKIIFNLALCVFISFMDGIGLSMFMPLLQAVGSGSTAANADTMGRLHFLTDFIENMGFTLNLNTVLATLVILFTLKGILKYIQLNYQVNMRHVFMRRVRYKLVDDLHDLSYDGFLKLDAGRIQNALISEVQRLFQTMNSYFNAAQALVMLITYILLAVLANYQFAILVALGAGLTNFIYRKIYIGVKNASKELSKKGSNFNSFLIQAIHHFKYLKATNYFTRFDKRLRGVIDETENLNKKIGYYNAITTSMREPMIIIVVVLVIYSQITWMGANLTTILLSLLLFYRALSFLLVVQNHWQTFMQNIGSMHSVAEFTDEMHTMREQQSSKIFDHFNKGIVFRNTGFAYGDKKVLQDINLTIPKNQTIALVGESGSGKTTLANMIIGLIKPREGEILLDDQPLNSYNLNSYRAKVGYITQEPVIFNDDIFNNITFWAEPTEVNKKRFWEVTEMSSLREFIEAQPQKEKTPLGDNGLLVSGGQKQRISIARELYKTADILILDEATSALDSETERLIQQNIEELHGRYTMVIIAHRLSTIRNADTIYLLEKGIISASGNFTEMLSISPRFKRMVELQEF
jgi:subfamily B ATP-binding cassette protein MsbA